MGGLRLALGLLTIIPSGPIGQVTPQRARVAMLSAPVVVLPICLLAGGAGWFSSWLGVPGLAVGLLVVAAMAVLTRGMHLDGLADTVDGLGAAWDRERARAVMKRGDVGPMGAVALIVVIGLQAVAAAALVDRPWGWLILAVALAGGRAAASIGCLPTVPPLSSSGLGAQVARSVPPALAAAQWVLLAVVAGGLGSLTGAPWWQGVLAVLLAAVSVALLVAHGVRRLGGVNGDVLGAAIELATTVLLLALSVGAVGGTR